MKRALVGALLVAVGLSVSGCVGPQEASVPEPKIVIYPEANYMVYRNGHRATVVRSGEVSKADLAKVVDEMQGAVVQATGCSRLQRDPASNTREATFTLNCVG